MTMDEMRILDGLAALEGVIVPLTPPPPREGRRSGSAGPSGAPSRSTGQEPTSSTGCRLPHQQEGHGACVSADQQAVGGSHLSGVPLQAGGAPTLAFFLQLPASSNESLTATVLPQVQSHLPQCSPRLLPTTAEVIRGQAPSPDRHVLRLSTAPDPLKTPTSDAAGCDPSMLHKALILLTFNSPAATHAALARLHAVALASQGRGALAALQPVPLVARAFANATAAGDYITSERAAVVLLALLGNAQLPLPKDVAGLVLIPAAIRVLGGHAIAAAVGSATVAAVAAAADASGTLSSTALHMHFRTYPTAAGPTAAPLPPPAYVHPPAAPTSCRLAAARLLLHLAILPPASRDASAVVASQPRPSPGPGAACDLLVSAGALEACCEVLNVAVAFASAEALELLCCTLQLLAALTADVTGWPWQWPVVRAAVVDGCAPRAVALMHLLDGGSGGAEWSGDDSLCQGDVGVETAAHAAARSVVLHLSRGPLLVREALIRAGVLSPVAEAIMMWPPPLLPTRSIPGAAGPPSGASAGSRLHFSLCLGILLNLSSLPRVRAALASPELGPLLCHLLSLLEQQPWESGLGDTGGQQHGERKEVHVAVAALQGAVDIQGTLLELLLNLALDTQCHAGLAAQKVEALLVRCIAAGQQVRLDLGAEQCTDATKEQLRFPYHQPTQQQQQPRKAHQQPWRAAAALRLMAALAADSRFSVPRPTMQLGLAAVGAVEVVAHEVQSALAALPAAGAVAAYDLALTALCALMTGNNEMQRRVAAMPELLTALSAALPNPAVARSDTRQRITLAAWRLITSPLTSPGSDLATARSLLLGLGQNPDMLCGPAVHENGFGGGGPGTEVPLLRPSKSSRPHGRQSLLLMAGELRGRSRSSLGLRPSEQRPSSELEVSELEQRSTLGAASTATANPGTTNRSSLITAVKGAVARGSEAGGGAVPPPVWMGPLLPGTPLPPPGAPPPDVAPLRLPSCVLTMSESAPPSSFVAGAIEEGSGRSLSRSRSSRRPSRTVEPPGRKSSPPPHRAALVPSDSNEDECREEAPLAGADVRSLGLTGRSASHRLAATPPASVTAALSTPVEPLLPQPDQPAPPPVLTHLPGALLPSLVDAEDGAEGVIITSQRRRSSSGSAGGSGSTTTGAEEGTGVGSGSRLGKGPRAIGDSTQLSTGIGRQSAGSDMACEPRATGLGPSTAFASIFSSSSVPAGGRPGDEAAVTAGSVALHSAARRDVDGAAAAAAAAIVAGSLVEPSASQPSKPIAVNPSLEMAPPLLCLVTHVQALLARPACRAVAALVLVQLAQLELVRGSGVMAAGWGALMEAVTSSLTGAAERGARESGGQPILRPGPSAAVTAMAPPNDPWDELALLEVLDVAAGSAAEGRAVMTSPSVVSLMCELSCGQGSLAASLARRDDHHSSQQPHVRPFHHYHHQQHQHGSGSDNQLQQQLQLQQPYLTRGRTLAMEILGELLGESQVAGQLQDGRAGAVLAQRLLHSMAAAAEVAEAVASPYTQDLGAAPVVMAEEQQRQRNAVARLLLRLVEHVACAREFLARPSVVSSLLELLSQLWDAHAPALVPATLSALLPRTGLTAGNCPNSKGFSHVLRDKGPITAAAAAVEANGGISASTSESNLNLAIANRRSSNLHADSHRRITGNGGTQSFRSPLATGGTAQGAATSLLGPPVPHPRPFTSDGSCLSVGLQASSVQQQRSQSPMSGAARGVSSTGNGFHAPAPHSVPTRMSLHAAVCAKMTQWPSPAQHAMKALEMSEERQQAPSAAPVLPVYRHAHTHVGTVLPGRPSPLSAAQRPSRHEGFGGVGGDVMSDSEKSGEEDSFIMLKSVAPPPKKPPSPPSAPPGGSRHPSPLLPPPPPWQRSAASGSVSHSGRLAEVALIQHVRRSDGGRRTAAEGDGADEPDGGGDGDGEDGQGLLATTVIRRGTRALGPPVAPGAGLPPGIPAAPRTAAAASAAQCISDLLHLLRLLVEGDVDAARTMATLPAVELFVDLLASSSGSLVLAVMELLERLAERQDAHETFWDCDAVAQLVSHMQMRSAAAVAAAAITAPDRATARRSSGDVITSAAGAGDETAALKAAPASASASAVTVAKLQVGAARVLQQLCGDPDLHGRLAATELPAALMAVVKRNVDQAGFLAVGALSDRSTPRAAATTASAANNGAQGPVASRALSSTSLLTCVLTALCSLLECADIRRQARERRLPLQLSTLAAGGGTDPLVAQLAALCGGKLRDEPPRLRTASSAGGPGLAASAHSSWGTDVLGNNATERPPLGESPGRPRSEYGGRGS